MRSDRRSRLATSALALALAAIAMVAGCQAPRNYDRGDSIHASLHVMFGDPAENAASFAEDVSSIVERAGRDAREFPQAVADFSSFFY